MYLTVLSTFVPGKLATLLNGLKRGLCKFLILSFPHLHLLTFRDNCVPFLQSIQSGNNVQQRLPSMSEIYETVSNTVSNGLDSVANGIQSGLNTFGNAFSSIAEHSCHVCNYGRTSFRCYIYLKH